MALIDGSPAQNCHALSSVTLCKLSAVRNGVPSAPSALLSGKLEANKTSSFDRFGLVTDVLSAEMEAAWAVNQCWNSQLMRSLGVDTPIQQRSPCRFH